MPAETVVLESNSYDLVRAPLVETIEADAASRHICVAKARKQRAADRAGKWRDDLGLIAALKVFASLLPAERRLTTGIISDGVLADEDYVEVLKVGSFGAHELQEARIWLERLRYLGVLVARLGLTVGLARELAKRSEVRD